MAEELLYPTSLADSNNLNGDYPDVDEDPDFPDGNWMTAISDNTNVDVRYAFDTPTNTPDTGAGVQTFRVWARQSNAGGNTPTLRIELWDAGSSITVGSDVSLTSTTGQMFTLTWDAADLTSSDGSGVECRVFVTAQGGSPTNRNSGDIGAVEWDAETSAAGTTLTGTHTPITVANNAGQLNPSLVGTTTTITPAINAGILSPSLVGTTSTITPAVNAGTLTASQTLDGVTTGITPIVNAGQLNPSLVGVTSTVTPTVNAGTLHAELVGATVGVTPTVNAGALGPTLVGATSTITPTVNAGTLAPTLAGTTTTITPTVNAGRMDPSLVGITSTVTPTVNAGALTSGTLLTGVATAITPVVNAGQLDPTLAGATVGITPVVNAGQLDPTLTGATVSITPVVNAGALDPTLAGTASTITPTVNAGALSTLTTLTGTTVGVSPTVNAGQLNPSVAGATVAATVGVNNGEVTATAPPLVKGIRTPVVKPKGFFIGNKWGKARYHVYRPGRRRPLGVILGTSDTPPTHVDDRPVSNYIPERGSTDPTSIPLQVLAGTTITVSPTVNAGTVTLAASYRFLNGVSSDLVIELADDASFNSMQSFTVSTWVKNDVPATNNQPYVWRWGAFGGDGQFWMVRPNNTNPLTVEIIVQGTDNSNYLFPAELVTNLIVADTWQHWVFVYANSVARIYLNGAQVTMNGASSWPAAIQSGGTAPLRVGPSTITGTYRNQDDIAVFNTDLSDAQCQALYSATADVDLATLDSYSNCVLWWRADGDIFDVATDHSTAGNDGTINVDMSQSDIDTTDYPP